MRKRSPPDELDDAVDRFMTKLDSALPRFRPDLEALLRIAADLRDLPSDEFRARVRAALLSRAKRVGSVSIAIQRRTL